MGNPPNGPIENPVKSTPNFLEALQPNINAQAVVRALESDGDTKLLSSPKMRVLVGRSSTLFSGSSEPYRETTFQNNQSVETVKFKGGSCERGLCERRLGRGRAWITERARFFVLREPVGGSRSPCPSRFGVRGRRSMDVGVCPPWNG